jgi:hypothetical protein
MKQYLTPDELIGLFAHSDEALRDIATFNNATVGDLIDAIQYALIGTHQHLMRFGILATPKQVGRELGRMAAVYNRGRHKAVTLKRPSPRLSRREYETIHAKAVGNIFARGTDGNP